MELDLGGKVLPFSFSLDRASDSLWVVIIHNGAEEIAVSDVVIGGDSISIRMPLFDSEFIGKIANDSLINGRWYNHLKGPDYSLPFRALAGAAHRFPIGSSTGLVSGSWETHFSHGTPDAYNAIGVFNADAKGGLTGTFLTETGDYRYLEGGLHNDSLRLSCFDGSHAFLFEAALNGDSLIGRFWSGSHWQEPWVATRNEEYKLRDPDSLTTLREGYDMIDFRFPDTEGKLVSSRDEQFRGRVLMVQVMGSWCPNCVDETRLLQEVYTKDHDRGLEIISIAFEKQADQERAIEGLKRFKTALDVHYPVLYGGLASKEVASAKLPFLEHLMSYPTCVFIDRAGRVRRIRTGFYGPGTGPHYDHYKRNLDVFLEGMLNEHPGAVAQK